MLRAEFRPRASLLLLSFNQEAHVQEAARACLAQDCEPIEIIFSDDASGDHSFRLLEQLVADYRGPHHLRLRRNPRNLGIGGHYNQLIEEAQGELLITAAGDDISAPDRVRKLLAAWDARGGRPDLLTSYLTRMDAGGKDLGLITPDDLSKWITVGQWLAHRPMVVGAAHAFTKRLHRHFGPFVTGLTYEDQIMALRASHLGSGLLIPEPLVRYREGGISDKVRKAAASGEARRAMRQSMLRKHRNHLAMYRQVLQDLSTLGMARQFPAKMRARLVRAEAITGLFDAPDRASRLAILAGQWRHFPAGWLACAEALVLAARTGGFDQRTPG